MDKFKKHLKDISFYVIVIIIVLVIRMYVVSLIKVNGNSMKETLLNNDIMILDKISYRFDDIKRFDIVVIKYNDEYLIKRVIGLPNEKVEYKNNKLYINNKKVNENFYHEKTEDFDLESLDATKVCSDCYIVLGDNRANSMDSRIIGFISREDIIGKATVTIFPFTRFGYKK